VSRVVIKQLNKHYPNGFHAVKNLDLEMAEGEFLVLVGPSGCGKSTTLRMVAGLEKVTSGTIQISDRVVNDLLPRDRDIAMVFQNYALYMHMSVYDNMAFGLRNRKVPKDEIERKVAAASEILGIKELLSRRPAQLSGGQRQRVALGRAIVRNPKVFLFDEPLSNLDAQLRTQMRFEIRRLHESLDATMIYVTHDQVEAMTLGDRVVVMKDGEISQVGTPLDLYERPRNKFVASFIGAPMMNFLPCRIAMEGGHVFAVSETLKLNISPDRAESLKAYRDREVIVGVRPENISLGNPPPGASVFKALVRGVEPLGPEQMLDVVLKNNFPLVVSRVDPHLPIRGQAESEFHIRPLHLHLFDPASGLAIGV